jgi:Bacteriocin-protection, YdeI or OmpD-Associated/Domain of unknown function (DUF1905)
MFSFPSPVLRLETQLRQHYVPIPIDIAEALEASGTRRVIATINGLTVRRAILRNKKGDRYIFVSMDMLRQIKASLEDVVLVDLITDPEPDRIDLGEEFEAVLAQDSDASERFFEMTKGRQRGLAHYVTSAKRIETRIKRAFEIAEKLRTYTLYDDREQG